MINFIIYCADNIHLQQIKLQQIQTQLSNKNNQLSRYNKELSDIQKEIKSIYKIYFMNKCEKTLQSDYFIALQGESTVLKKQITTITNEKDNLITQQQNIRNDICNLHNEEKKNIQNREKIIAYVGVVIATTVMAGVAIAIYEPNPKKSEKN